MKSETNLNGFLNDYTLSELSAAEMGSAVGGALPLIVAIAVVGAVCLIRGCE